ncbi:uncharacterized protein fam83ha isoform X2 [Hoplias malabaricus]
MARRSQCSSAGDNLLDPNYLPPHYREEYRLAIDALIEAGIEGYYGFLHEANVVDFLSQPEIGYIKCRLQGPLQRAQPERKYMIGEGDGSSDTYWPTQSDLDAPGLDLGWPPPQRFVGPTEITTLVNPPDPEMPSIKEQVRRMIKNAQQVVAVAMDMFTDVDIFADILNAAMRNVAVYILLDEMNSHHFVAMANNCRVNLHEIKFLRIRIVSGSTYFCHTGKSFKGQMMNRFVLVDCRIVLSGNYSFMWCFEKIHRYLAHVFTGQLVANFDEEFRILYAHSEPLVIENPVTFVEDYRNIPVRHSLETPHIYKREYPAIEHMHVEWPAHASEDHINVQSKMLPFRRSETILSSKDEHIFHPTHDHQQFRGEHSYLDQRRFMKVQHTKEMGGFRRHVYPGVPHYPPISTVNKKQNIEGLETQSAQFPREQYFSERIDPDPSYHIYGKSGDHSYHQLDHFPGPDFPHVIDDSETLGDYDHVQRYLHTCSAVETGPAGNLLVPGQSTHRRHSMGQSYTCQTSPTQPNPTESKYFLKVLHKQGQKGDLRDWRISSYLTALQPPEQEDISDIQRTDSSDCVPYVMQGRPHEPEFTEARQDNSEIIRFPTSKKMYLPVQPLNTLTQPEKRLGIPLDFRTVSTNAKPTPPTTSESSCNTEGDKSEELQNRESKDTNLICEEFVRRRPNLAFQRSSRLRHSLIFNSNLELNTLEDIRNPLSQDNGDDPSKHCTVVSNMLEKKKAATRDLFKWSNLVKSSDTSSDPALKTDSENMHRKEETCEGEKDESVELLTKDSQQEANSYTKVQPQDALAENSQTTQLPTATLHRSVPLIDMNDPDCRLRYFKELAAKRKAELASLATKDSAHKEHDKPYRSHPIDTVEEKDCLDTSKNPQAATALIPTSLQKLPLDTFKTSQDSCTKANNLQNLPDKLLKHKLSPDIIMTQENISKSYTPCRAMPTSATDAEKIKLKQQLTDSSSNKVEIKSICDTSPGEITAPKCTKTQLSSEFISPKTKSPCINNSDASSLPAVLTPKHLKHNLTDSLSSHFVKGANLPLKPSSMEPSSCYSVETDKTNKITSQYPGATETGYSKHPVPGEIEPPQCFTSAKTSLAPQTDTRQHMLTKKTAPNEHPPVACQDENRDSNQNHSAKTIGLSQYPTTEESFSPTVKDTKSSHHVTTKETSYSKHSKEIGPSQCLAVKENCPFQHPTEVEFGLFQHPSAKETGPPQHPRRIHSGLSQCFSAEETGASHCPTAKETGLSLHQSEYPAEVETDTSVKKTEPFQNPMAKETGPSQQPTEKEFCLSQTLGKEADTSLSPTAKETGTSQPSNEKSPNVADSKTGLSQSFCGDLFKCPSEMGPSKLFTVIASPPKHVSTSESGLSQHPLEIETGPSQHHTEKETGLTQHPPAKETGISQPSIQKPPNAADSKSDFSRSLSSDPSKHPAQMEPSKLLTAMASPPKPESASESGLSQHPLQIEASPFLHHTEKETTQPPPATETDTSQQSTEAPLIEADSKTDFSKSFSEGLSECPTEIGPSKPANWTFTAMESPPNPASTSESGLSHHPLEIEIGATQHLPEKETLASQPSIEKPPNAADIKTDLSQSLSSDPSKHPTETELCTAMASPPKPESASESGLSKNYLEIDIGLSQHPTERETGLSQQLPLKQTGSSPQPMVGPSLYFTETVSRPKPDTKSDISIHSEPCFCPSTNLTGTKPLAPSTLTKVDSGPHTSGSSFRPDTKDSIPLTVAGNKQSMSIPTSGLLSPETVCSNSTEESHLPSQCPTTIESGFISESSTTSNCTSINITSKYMSQKDNDSATTLSANVLFPEDFSAKPNSLNTGLGDNPLPESNSDLSLTITETDPVTSAWQIDKITGHHESDMSSLPLNTTLSDVTSTICSTASETGLCANSTVETVFVASPTQADTSTPAEHNTVKTSSCIAVTATIDNFEPATSILFSVATSDTTKTDLNSLNDCSQSNLVSNLTTSEYSSIDHPIQKGSTPELPEAQMLTCTQCCADIKFNNDVNTISSELFQPLNQSDRENLTDQDITYSPRVSVFESKDKEHNKECTEEQIQLQEASRNIVWDVVVEVPKNLDKKMEQNSKERPQGTNVEQSQELQTCTDLVSQQSPAADRPPCPSSTVNILSCSNLRDDTKVLLEQISAKNEGRMTKMSLAGTHAVKEEVDNVNSNTDKKNSGYLPSRHQTWTSRASAEEREKLLKRMESMRKEKKVYSRFEA